MSKFGNIGRPVLLYEGFMDYRDDLMGKAESGEIDLAEAKSKADFASFLYGPVQQSVYEGYTKVTPQYRRYGAIENVNDFRSRRIRGLNGISGIAHVGDTGEYAELDRTERPNAELVIDTYGGVYGITRQAIINDDSGSLLKDNPSEMGYAAAVFVTETIIAYIESNPTAPDGNPTFDAGTHSNAATAALSEDSLATAISTMENQVDDIGRQIVVRPRTLAVKNVRLELIANRIIRSQDTGFQTATTTASDVFDKGTMNPLAGILPADAVVRDPYWSDANDWYLFADPNDVKGFAIGFLNGKEEPSVFLKDAEARVATGSGTDPYTWEIDSVDFKVRLDFGVTIADHRAVYRSIVT
jgi:hypothetical protein